MRDKFRPPTPEEIAAGYGYTTEELERLRETKLALRAAEERLSFAHRNWKDLICGSFAHRNWKDLICGELHPPSSLTLKMLSRASCYGMCADLRSRSW
jgi:hypothetical protein